MPNLVITDCKDGEIVHFRGKTRSGEYAGGWSVESKIDLLNSTYTTGGYVFDTMEAFGLYRVVMMDVLAKSDPYCDDILPVGVQLVLDCTDPCEPTIVVYDEDGEVANGWVPNETLATDLWVRVYGRR